MIDWRTIAYVALLGLLSAGYMARAGHMRYFADLLGLCAAIYTERPQLALLACALLAISRHNNWVAGGLAAGLPEWLGQLLLPGGYNMSSAEEEQSAQVNAASSLVLPSDQPVEIAEISQPVAENSTEMFSCGEIAAAARLVAAGAVKLTEAVKIGLAAKSGDRYSRRTKELQKELKKLLDQYPNRTEQQEQLRQSLKM